MRRLIAINATEFHAVSPTGSYTDSPAAAAREAYREQLKSQEEKKDWEGAANTTRWLYLLDHQEDK